MGMESRIESQMKNQIRHLQEDDIDAIAKIWLDTNMEAHSFVPAEYWEGNLALVKEMFLQAEMYVYSENGEIWVLLGWIKAILRGFLCGRGRSPRGIGKALLDIVKEKKAELALHVYRKNEKAVRFYLREGFRIQREMTGRRYQRRRVSDGVVKRDYCVLKFTAEKGRHYCDLKSESFVYLSPEDQRRDYGRNAL